MQHATPAVVLLFAGLNALAGGVHGFGLALAVVEIVSSVLLIGSFAHAVRTIRRRRNSEAPGPAHHGVDWIDIFTGGVLLVEAAERYHLTHHLPRPTIVLGCAMLALGLLHGRILHRAEKRLSLRLDEAGIYVGGKLFRSIHAPWDQVTAIEIGPRFAFLRFTGGRERKLDLADLEGASAVRAALEEARQRIAAAALEAGVAASPAPDTLS